MNRGSWVALIIASIISRLFYYFRDYSRGSKGKFSEGSDTKATEQMKRIN